MTGPCDVQATGAIDLYFYDELASSDRARLEQHLSTCAACRAALDELRLIRTALAARPVVSAPPGGDWSGFMSRLGRTLDGDRPANADTSVVVFGRPAPSSSRAGYVGYLAMAALLALVTMSVLSVMRWRASAPGGQVTTVRERPGISAVGDDRARQGQGQDASAGAALAATSEQHFERSKLVLLGLNAKDASAASPEEWTYERELASSLLSDTRLYRMTAEERGMTSLAAVLRDLELVLLQVSFTESDPESLGQLQRLIRKRNLLEKMNVVTTSGI